MDEIDSISEIASKSHYENTAEKFFSHFPSAWKKLKHQVLKLETKQIYIEPGNESYEFMLKGDVDTSIKMMEESLSEDDATYKDLQSRGVDFIRCRPIQYPLTDYLKWELETYKITSEKGVRIYCCEYNTAKHIFERVATHDFMVFDSDIAFIHNYDENGLIRGGWIVNDPKDIFTMQSIFISIKAISSPFRFFL
jgi:hypothetical protein